MHMPRTHVLRCSRRITLCMHPRSRMPARSTWAAEHAMHEDTVNEDAMGQPVTNQRKLLTDAAAGHAEGGSSHAACLGLPCCCCCGHACMLC